MPYFRALGFAALATAPILLATLAVAATRPDAPSSLVTRALWVAWLAGGLAFGAARLHQRGAMGAARGLGAVAALIVLSWIAFLVWLSTVIA